jgi:hypothetical protein
VSFGGCLAGALRPFDASNDESAPLRKSIMGDKSAQADLSFSLTSRGCTTNSNPNSKAPVDARNVTDNVMPTISISRALISSFVYRLLATATTTNLHSGFYCTGCFVFDAFAVHSCTVSATAEGYGQQANQD